MAFRDGEIPDKHRGYTSGGVLGQINNLPITKIDPSILTSFEREMLDWNKPIKVGIPDRAELIKPSFFSDIQAAPTAIQAAFSADPLRFILGVDLAEDPEQLNIKVKRKRKLKFNFNN